jgi:hypothetical protein
MEYQLYKVDVLATDLYIIRGAAKSRIITTNTNVEKGLFVQIE